MSTTTDDCIFCRIARGEIPARKLFEDDEIVAFHDISPKAPVHFLIVPKHHLVNLYEADESHQRLLGRMMVLAGELARGEGAHDGFRVVVNNGRVGGQEVYHLHIHVLGGNAALGSGMPR